MAGPNSGGSSAHGAQTLSCVGVRKVNVVTSCRRSVDISLLVLLASLSRLTVLVEGFEPISAAIQGSRSKHTHGLVVTGPNPWKSSHAVPFAGFPRCKRQHSTNSPKARLALHARNPSTNSDSPKEGTVSTTRRMALPLLLAGATVLGMPTLNTNNNNAAWAITREYPVELTSVDVGVSSRRRMAEEKVQKARKQTISDSTEDPLKLRDGIDLATTIVWSGALWLGLGSRSNFLVRPLANILYEADQNADKNTQDREQSTESKGTSLDGGNAGSSAVAAIKTGEEQGDGAEDEDEGAFVRDRNEGYFSELPFGLSFVLAAVFIASGWALNRFLTLFLLSGDSDLNLQLAGVTLIAGGAVELGRLASGEKQMTRDEADRALRLQAEFQQFAADRLVVQRGGNVHRSEVSASFRRYYAKYRNTGETSTTNANNDPSSMLVNDLEIERLMRSWNRQSGSRDDMSRAGFFTGVQLNKAADITTSTSLSSTR